MASLDQGLSVPIAASAAGSLDRFDFVRKLEYFPSRVQAVLDRRLSDAISTVYLDVNTDICNHACPFCDGYYRQLKAAEIPWSRLETLVDEMKELGVLSLVIAGDRGEPFLHSKFRHLLVKLNASGIRYGIYTNGTCVKESYLEPLRGASFIRVSADAARPATHQKMHGYPASQHDFETVLRNVELLSALVPDLGVSFILDAPNVEEIDEAADAFLSRHARFIEYKPKYSPGYGVDSEWLRRHARMIRAQLDRAIARWGERVQLNPQIPRLLDGGEAPSLAVAPRFCRTSLLRLVISTHGCYTCTPYRGEAERRVGSILEQSLRDVVESAERRALDEHPCSRQCAYHRQNEYLLQLEAGTAAVPPRQTPGGPQDYFV